MGRQNTEGCKNCNAFLVHGLTERDEIWQCLGNGHLFPEFGEF